MTSRAQFKPGKTSNKDTGSARETSYPKTCDLLFSSPCVLQILRELTAQQHLFPDYAQMRAHIVTVINSRARGPAPMMIRNLNEEASTHDASSDELVEGEDGGNTKGGGKGRTDKECLRCGRIGHIRADCRAKTHLNGGPPKSGLEVARKKSKKHRKTCRLGPLIWSLLKCCQTTVTPKKTAKSLLSLIVGMNTVTFCSKRIPGHGTRRSLYPLQKDAFL